MVPPVVKRSAAKRPSTPVLGLTLAFTDLSLAAYFFVRARRIFETDTSGFGGWFEVGVAELFGLFSVGAALASGLAFILRRKWSLLSEYAGVVSVICGLVPPGLVVAFIGLEHFG
jgi:hypothetical protein